MILIVITKWCCLPAFLHHYYCRRVVQYLSEEILVFFARPIANIDDQLNFRCQVYVIILESRITGLVELASFYINSEETQARYKTYHSLLLSCVSCQTIRTSFHPKLKTELVAQLVYIHSRYGLLVDVVGAASVCVTHRTQSSTHARK